MLGYFLIILRVFQSVVFTFTTAVAITMAFTLDTALYRRWLLISFAILSAAIAVRAIDLAYTHQPWVWWSLFPLISAIIACIGLYFGWRDRQK